MRSLRKERRAWEWGLFIACIGVMSRIGLAHVASAEGPASASGQGYTAVETRRVLRDDPPGTGHGGKSAAARHEGESFQRLRRSQVPLQGVSVRPGGWKAAAAGAPRAVGIKTSLPGGPGCGCRSSASVEAVAALPTYRCRHAPGPLRADELWDDAGWLLVASTGPFLNWDAHGVPEYPSEARLAYDARNLYAGFHCTDRDIYSPYQNRDDPLWNEDVVELFIRLPSDPLHYYEFEVSPANLVFDAKIFNPTGSGEPLIGDKAWNAAGLKTAVRVEGTLNQRGNTDRSWTVQMSLPFTALGLHRAPTPGTIWRVNLYRVDPSSENRFAAWSPTLGERPNFHRPQRFGYLKFAP
jgi:hypothetical protein